MPSIVSLQRANHGAHFRAYGLRGDAGLIDPFLGVDHAWMSAPTFPPHPHAGFSAVSYVFLDSETGIANRDSMGTQNLILPGGLHWTAAGRGVVHEEVPAEPGKTAHSLQIFVNLPQPRRDDAPFALSLAPQDIPVALRPGVKVRVVAGRFCNLRSPVAAPTAVDLLDVSLEGGAELSVPVAPGHAAFLLSIFGTVMVDGQSFGLDDLKAPVYPAQQTPHEIKLRASRGAAKVMFFSGAPLQLTSV